MAELFNTNKKRLSELCLDFIRKSLDCEDRYIFTPEGSRHLDMMLEESTDEKMTDAVIEAVAVIDALKDDASGKETERTRSTVREMRGKNNVLQRRNRARRQAGRV